MSWPALHIYLKQYGLAMLIFVAGLLLSIVAFSLYHTGNLNVNSWIILTLGILLTCLTTVYARILINQRIQVEKEVSERVKDMAAINIMLQKEISERHKIEGKLIDKQRHLQKRHETLEYLTKFTTSEFRSAIQEVILRAASVMMIERVGIWLYEMSGPTPILACSGLYQLSSHTFVNHLEFSSVQFPFYFEALSKQSHLILPSSQDAALNQELSSYLAAYRITAKLDVPIVFENKLLGVLSCEETQGHREWTLEDRYFCQTIADIIAIIIEQSGRRKAEKALLDSEEQLRFITQSSIDGIITINDKEEILAWNFGAEQMFGFREAEMQGKLLSIVLPQPNMIATVLSSVKPIEFNGMHKDGHLFPVEISHTRWEKKDIHYDTIIIRDITERKATEKHLIKAMKEAKAANASKNEFLAMISHELRTPLNAIIGFDQCLLMGMDGVINDAQRVSLKKIEKSSFHLLNLINDILDWSKIEAHRMKLEIMSVNIIEIVSSCVEEMLSLAKQKNLDLHFDVTMPIIMMNIDKVRIRQVVLNLLSNAIKFTEQGSITVSVINEPHQTILQVKDTGIGLLAEEIKKIFQPFTQADRSISRRYGGTGLGLMISKKIIELHGGVISVESEKGKGSTFTVSLPKSTGNIP